MGVHDGLWTGGHLSSKALPAGRPEAGPPPVIKWTGSKRRIAPDIVKTFPGFDAYYEPFLGGGSILVRTGARKAVCGDICKPLVDLWNAVKSSPSETADEYERRWRGLQDGGPDFFYGVRRRFNELHDPHDLLFLSRTCVNGLIRFNRRGEFNNTFHHTRKGIDPARLRGIIHRWSGMVQRYRFVHGDYAKTAAAATRDDFIYLDPPYSNTVGIYYGKIDTGRLVRYMEGLNEAGIRFALSFDGTRGTHDYVHVFPKGLFRRHMLLESGHSSFNRLQDRRLVRVRESLYLNF